MSVPMYLVYTFESKGFAQIRVVRALAIVSQATRTLLWAH